ncbi:MAG: hypothetical protein JSS76_00640 [Bacteroidetes bacterium]|nr:hypothetical protein [Bacteroidota bacterium]
MERQDKTGYSVLSDFIGLFSDPISSFLSPIIKLWEIEVERKKLQILHEQLRSRTELQKSMIEAKIFEITAVIQQRNQEFEIIRIAFSHQFRLLDDYHKTHGETFAMLGKQLIIEKDTIKIKIIEHLMLVITSNASANMNAMLNMVSPLLKTQNVLVANILNQLNS